MIRGFLSNHCNANWFGVLGGNQLGGFRRVENSWVDFIWWLLPLGWVDFRWLENGGWISTRWNVDIGRWILGWRENGRVKMTRAKMVERFRLSISPHKNFIIRQKFCEIFMPFQREYSKSSSYAAFYLCEFYLHNYLKCSQNILLMRISYCGSSTYAIFYTYQSWQVALKDFTTLWFFLRGFHLHEFFQVPKCA